MGDNVIGTKKTPPMKVIGEFDRESNQHTITLEELCRRLNEAADGMGRQNPNRLLLLNSAAALRTLGEQLVDADAIIRQLRSSPIPGPGGGQHVN